MVIWLLLKVWLLPGGVSWVTLYFFTGIRRHTTFDCDWSSDVCSSDLRERPFADVDDAVERALERHWRRRDARWAHALARRPFDAEFFELALAVRQIRGARVHLLGERRSEERRVGKECRSRWSADH